MALTRANFEAVLIQRCGAALTRVGLDGSTASGANAVLADPIRVALRGLGYVVSDPVTPTDLDLAAVPSARYETLFDRGELRTLETVLSHATDVDEKYGEDEQKNSQFAAQISRRIKDLTERINRSRGPQGGAVIGLIETGYQAPTTLLPGDPRRWRPR